jgi:hypothetical protein
MTEDLEILLTRVRDQRDLARFGNADRKRRRRRHGHEN